MAAESNHNHAVAGDWKKEKKFPDLTFAPTIVILATTLNDAIDDVDVVGESVTFAVNEKSMILGNWLIRKSLTIIAVLVGKSLFFSAPVISVFDFFVIFPFSNTISK